MDANIKNSKYWIKWGREHVPASSSTFTLTVTIPFVIEVL